MVLREEEKDSGTYKIPVHHKNRLYVKIMFAFFNLGVTLGLHSAPLSYSSKILLNTYPWTAFMALMCENLQNSV